MTTPAKLKFTIYQGATFRRRLRWSVKGTGVPIDLTGCTARMQVRVEKESPTALLTLTTENGGISLAVPQVPWNSMWVQRPPQLSLGTAVFLIWRSFIQVRCRTT